LPQPQTTGALYRFRDDTGAWVYTNDPDSVPAGQREGIEAFVPKALHREGLEERAERVKDQAQEALEELPGKAKALGRRSKKQAEAVQREVGDVVPFVKDLDLPSVAVGFALSLVLWVGSSVVRRSGRLLFKLAGIALVVALVVGAYFGWLRRAAGLSDSQLSNPASVIQDAKGAAEQMQRRLQKNERTLRQLEETSR